MSFRGGGGGDGGGGGRWDVGAAWEPGRGGTCTGREVYVPTGRECRKKFLQVHHVTYLTGVCRVVVSMSP